MASFLAMAAASAQAGLVTTLTEQDISKTIASRGTSSGSLDLSGTALPGSGHLGGSSPNFLMAKAMRGKGGHAFTAGTECQGASIFPPEKAGKGHDIDISSPSR